MREIKFRAWHKSLKKMLYAPSKFDSMLACRDINGEQVEVEFQDILARDINGNLFPSYKEKLWANMTWDGRWYQNGEFQDVVFQQYAGLKDKNGRELYEGDIIKYPLGQVIITAEVRWGDCSWILYDIEYKCIIGHLTCAIKRYEVIGNIFEHPELLK